MPLLPKDGMNATLGGLPISGGRRAEMDDPFAEATRAAAHGVVQAGNALLQHQEETEARASVVKSSEIRAKYAAELDRAAKSGEDLTNLKQKMNDELANVGVDFQTRKGADSIKLYTANTNLMFDEQANQINVQRAFSQAKIDAHKLLTSSSAIIASNPGYLKAAEENVDALVSTFTGIRADQRATVSQELKQELNLAAAVSAARTDPKGTLKRLEGGEWNLTSQQREHAMNRANTEISAQRTEQAYLEAQVRAKRNEENEDAWYSHSNAILKGDMGQSRRRAILDDPKLKPQTVEHLIALMDLRTKELTNGEKKSDPTVVRDLWLKINAPATDPDKLFTSDEVIKAVREGKINTTDGDKLSAMVANQKDENNRTFGTKLNQRINMIGGALRQAPQLAGQPELVAAIQIEIMERAEKKAAEVRKAGTSPDAMFDSGSSDFFFSRDLISSVTKDMRAAQSAALPQPPAPKTQEEYNAIPAGTVYIDTDGKSKVKGKLREAPATAGEDKRLSPATLHYNAAREGVPLDELNPYTGKPRAPAAEAPPPPGSKALKFDPLRGGVQPKGQ